MTVIAARDSGCRLATPEGAIGIGCAPLWDTGYVGGRAVIRPWIPIGDGSTAAGGVMGSKGAVPGITAADVLTKSTTPVENALFRFTDEDAMHTETESVKFIAPAPKIEDA